MLLHNKENSEGFFYEHSAKFRFQTSYVFFRMRELLACKSAAMTAMLQPAAYPQTNSNLQSNLNVVFMPHLKT